MGFLLLQYGQSYYLDEEALKYIDYDLMSRLSLTERSWMLGKSLQTQMKYSGWSDYISAAC